MSTAAATADAAAPKKGSKKLIIIIAAAVLVLVLGGGTAALLLSKKSSAQDEDAEYSEDEDGAAPAVSQREPGAPPTFVPLDAFTVNLADRETERYAQVGITLEVADAKLGDQIKLYMPAVRNNILMALADKTAAQLMDREGKKLLAEQVMRETSRALGYEVEEPEEADAEEEEAPRKKKRKKARAPALPVTAVHFSNFIIQ